MGRPTKYKPEYARQAKELCLLGAKDTELARFFETSEQTINAWKKAFPEFLESLKEGKQLADAKIAESLYHRALGYSHEDVHISNYQGKITVTPTTKHYPPDTTAAIFWLKNRQTKNWSDRKSPEEGIQVIVNRGGAVIQKGDEKLTIEHESPDIQIRR